MIVATSSLPWDKSITPKSLEQRMLLLEEALQKCRTRRVNLLCLPAGYFKVRHDPEREKLGRSVAALARATGVGVAVGVDVGSKGKKSLNAKEKKRRSLKLTRAGRRSAWALVSTPNAKQPYFSRQRSVSSRDQRLVPDECCERPNTVPISGKRVEILCCGEIFNERIRKGAKLRQPELIVDLGHKSAGFRVDGPLKYFSRHRIWSFCSAHAAAHSAMKRAYAPGGKKKSSRAIDILLDGPARLEIKLWNI